MKRLAVLIVMAAALAASCVKEPVDNNFTDTDKVDEGNGTYIYTVKASATPETRSNYDDGGVFSWSDGDAISVLFHNGTQNKFFTLTIDSADAGKKTASFSGAIDDGYEIGASDGTTSDMKIWALFPASDSHTYTPGSNPSFYVQPEVDFSATHFSANIPMYALNTQEAAFSFANLASTYKFTVKDIDDSITKIRFEVYNQTTYALSGSWPIHNDKYINYDYASPGSAKSHLTYISDVTDGKAVFYVSCRYYGEFKPVITIYDIRNLDDPLKTLTADKIITPSSKTKVKQISISAPGTVFIPKISIDGSFDDWASVSRVFPTTASHIEEWKYTTDARNLYFLYKIPMSQITMESGDYHDNKYIYIGLDTDNKSTSGTNTGITATLGGGIDALALIHPWSGTAPAAPTCVIGENDGSYIKCPADGSSKGKLYVGAKVVDSYCYVETAIPLSSIGSPAGPVKVTHAFGWSPVASQLIMPEPTTITAEDQTVGIGKTVSIGATTNSTAAISYTSNNTAVATVDANGVITGVSAGNTTITINVPAVSGEYAAATETINVTVDKITIDGDFDDWDGISVATNTGSSCRYKEFKVTSDANNIYFYLQRTQSQYADIWGGQAYVYFAFDFGNDPSTATSSIWGNGPYDMIFVIWPFGGSSTSPAFATTPLGDSTISPSGDIKTHYKANGTFDAEIGVELEFSIPRADLPTIPAQQITIYSWGNKGGEDMKNFPLSVTL